MEGREVWNPWLVGKIIYSSRGEYGKTSPRGESFVPAPKAHAWAGPYGGSIPCAPSPTKSPPTEVHAPCHMCFCLPGHLGNSQGEDHCIRLGLTVHLAEENNLPKRDQPCLLAESIVELRREVGFYLSLTDKEVFQGVELPQEERSSLSVPTATPLHGCHWQHQYPRNATHIRGSSKVCWMEHSDTPILTCGSCRGNTPANCYAKGKEKNTSTKQNYFH